MRRWFSDTVSRLTIPQRRCVAVALGAVGAATALGAARVVALFGQGGSGVDPLIGVTVSSPLLAVSWALFRSAARVLGLVTGQDRASWRPSRYHEQFDARRRRSG